MVDIFAKAHIVLDELARELFKLAAYRQQHDGRNKTEHRVHIRDAAGGKRPSHRASSTPNECSSISPTITRIEPAMLKRIWITPVRLASAFEPMEQTMAVVTQSPMLTPMMMA